MKYVLYAFIAIAAVLLGVLTEWKYVLAPLLGLAFFRWATASLRSMASGGYAEAPTEPEPVAPDAPERTFYWCEECGTELLLIVRGSGKSPRHCGTGMHERAELLRAELRRSGPTSSPAASAGRD